MRRLMADVALLTDRRYTAEIAAEGDWYLQNILDDDRLLRAALERRGLSSDRVDWSRPDIDWSAYRCLLFRTTWDYFDRFAEFTAWLDRVERLVPLCNPAETIRWNLDKHYLADLQRWGIPVVPSRYLEQGSSKTVAEVMAEAGWTEAVVKPCVSGAARHTYRLDSVTTEGIDPIVRQLLADEALIVQPFMRSVPEHGEDSLVVIGGRYSHAVRKLPKAGDFRVQDDYGGTVHEWHPTPDQIELAERAVAACRPLPTYARADLVRDNDGRLTVMELELIEPELWLRYHPPAADALAGAVAASLDAVA